MTLEELADLIDALRNRPSWRHTKDSTVRVRLSGQKSIGPLAAADVKSIYAGFDWDSSMVFIDTEEPLIRLSCPDNMKILDKP